MNKAVSYHIKQIVSILGKETGMNVDVAITFKEKATKRRVVKAAPIVPVKENPKSAVEMMTMKEVAAVLCLSERYVYEYVEQNNFPLTRIGNRKLVKKEALNEWIKNNTNSKI